MCRTQCQNLHLQIIANGKKGVLARSRLSKVEILKLMCKNIMCSTCLVMLVLDASPHQEGPWLIDIYMFPMGCKFYLKTGSPDLFPKCVSQAFPQQAQTQRNKKTLFSRVINEAFLVDYLVFLINFPSYLKFRMSARLTWICHFSPVISL